MNSLEVDKNDSSISDITEKDNVLFDEYAADYEAALEQGLSVSGENKDYFAEQRILWLSRRLGERGVTPKLLMDFGCGTGTGIPYLSTQFNARHIIGVDVSKASIVIAQRNHSTPQIQFSTLNQYSPAADRDLVFCNGVFHHIPPANRPEALDYIKRSLKPGGIFAFWENNPWNPGTRYIMSRIPFDRDAITVPPPEASSLLAREGFQILHTDFRFFFPRSLAFLRGMEESLIHFPLGAQYMVLCQKPTA